jgi:hypothetical protein
VGEHAGRPLARLVNVPFLHARPTWGDVVACARDAPGFESQLAWDREGLPFARLGERIHADGGRWAMIVDYRCEGPIRMRELSLWLREEHDVVAEPCFGPREDRAGRLYLAVPAAREPGEVLGLLDCSGLGFSFELIHPRDDEPRDEEAGA